MVLKVGLTGGIASGKTSVLRQLHALGCFTLDADEIVHTLYRSDSEIFKKIVRAFSNEILHADGRINRKKLGDIVFSDGEKRKCLNSIVHPAVFAEEERRLEAYRSRVKEGIAVVDAALMIESGSYIRYDKVIVVIADIPIRLKRLMLRDSCTEEQALEKINTQMPDNEKAKYGHYVIENNGTKRELEEKTRDVYACLLRDKKTRNSRV